MVPELSIPVLQNNWNYVPVYDKYAAIEHILGPWKKKPSSNLRKVDFLAG